MKRKTVTMGTLDKTFSKAVRMRDNYTCQYKHCEHCGNQSLEFAAHDRVECAHYYNRYRASGRWHPDNCAALCHKMHVFLEHNKALEVAFFEGLLGKERHDALVVRHQGTYRYKPWERAEMNQHLLAQTQKMKRQRMDGEQGTLILSAWD